MKKKFISGNWFLNNLKQFGTFDLGDLDLWPYDPKINRVPLLPRMDVWIKFEKGRSRRSQVIDQKQFWHIWPVTLTFDPVTPISIGFIWYPGWMCWPGMRKAGQGILYLLIGNGFGRSRWPWRLTQFSSYWSEIKSIHTDRQTDMCKAICTLFLKGGVGGIIKTFYSITLTKRVNKITTLKFKTKYCHDIQTLWSALIFFWKWCLPLFT